MNNFTILHKISSNNRISIFRLFPQAVRANLVRIFTILLLGLVATTTLHAADIIHNINTGGNLTIPGGSNDNYIIVGNGSVTTNYVTIQSGYKKSITLDGVQITRSAAPSCITVVGLDNRSNRNPETKVNIILKGDNTLQFTGRDYCPIQVNQGAQIHISAIEPGNNASGTLLANSTNSSGGGAGIGARNYSSGGTGMSPEGTSAIIGGCPVKPTAGGNVIISSGTIVARGGAHAAGIGGGWYTYYNGFIIVYGGKIEARASYHAAGIGSGCPNGGGVTACYADQSTIIALHPAEIKAVAAHTSGPNESLEGLTGAKNITYMNDPRKPAIIIQTKDEILDADIYLDLTETNDLQSIFNDLGITYDLTKVKIGKTKAIATNPLKGALTINGRFEQETTFFTDASSYNTEYFGRPYMPVKQKVIATTASTIILPFLSTNIALNSTAATPLEVGYTPAQALKNSYLLKIEYNDPLPMTGITFGLQSEATTDFLGLKFYGADGVTEMHTPPTSLSNGQVIHIRVPIKNGKPLGIYQDVLRFSGTWNGFSTGYIRQIIRQEVVFDDTQTNTYIKVTASPDKFTAVHPATNKVKLALNIDNKGTATYDASEVTAKYLVTTEANYDAALAATPLNQWTQLNVPATENLNKETEVDFTGKDKKTYYIHWYVVSGVVYAHSRTVIAPPHIYGGFGPYIIYAKVQPGMLSGNPYVCSGQIPSPIIGEVSTGGSGNFTYQWQTSTNGTTWTNVGTATTNPNYTPTVVLNASPTHFRRITKDALYGDYESANTFKISIAAVDQTLYWKKNATNSNWNDPTNWVNASSVVQNMVPLTCTNVFISSSTTGKYPSLHVDDSPIDVYGSPICNNITFAYGSELAHPHKLAYEKAYVQYNFGYYNPYIVGQPQQNDQAGSPVLKRDTWYPIAAPLKKMASGDFSFGGYPFTWQAAHDLVTGASGSLNTINFKKQNTGNDVNLGLTHNVMGLKVAAYTSSKKGHDDHKHLQTLKGILQIPYFDNNSQATSHPMHSYDPISTTSSFYYYDINTLQQLANPVGKMKRGDEAFKFIFEGSLVTQSLNGENVQCYKLEVTPGSDNKVLIGNPFVASINMSNFKKANANALKASDDIYYVYKDGTSPTWTSYTYTGTQNGVNPLQAFVITLKSAAKTTLYFPLEGGWKLTGTTTNNVPVRSETPGALAVKASNQIGQGGDYAELSSVQGQTANVSKMISEDGHILPEVFFVEETGNNYNLIQNYKHGASEVGIGVKCSDTQSELSLTFDRIVEFTKTNNTRPVLVDKLLGIEQDLTEKNYYRFRQHTTANAQSQYADKKRFAIRFDQKGTKANDDSNLKVIYNRGYLQIKAPIAATQVEVYNLNGQLLFNSGSIDTTDYQCNLPLAAGSYVVKVKTVDGELSSSKIIVADY